MAANPILICAPSETLRARLEQLGELGYVTTSVATAADAVNALRTQPFDLIVAEGLAISGAVGRIREAAPNRIALIVISPAGDVEARIAFLEAGADEVLAASFAARELEAKV